ncbi:MAG: preprotein translocase subunit YajC [Planctomycetes bacterium]|nr:preprotein translocase subunit YajC [Planctomycetota bacterium]
MDEIMELVLAESMDLQETGTEGSQGTAEQEGGQTGESGAAGEDPTVTNEQAPSIFDSNGIWLMLAMMLVMYFFIFRGPRKRQEQQAQKMKESLQRNVRVRTIGGIIGTVVDVREDEVVIKIDETNNTKMRVTKGAIHKVLVEEEDKNK